MHSTGSNPLCLECGLCCNGVIFATGRLQPDDNPARLRSLGLALVQQRKPGTGGQKFHQPCAAFDGCHCRIYSERPKYCREFECRLLLKLDAGDLETSAARKIIRTARQRADTVRRLLRELGDADESVALSLRFRRMKRRMESEIPDEETADVFGRLTLAVHDLNVLLSEAFYSEPRD